MKITEKVTIAALSDEKIISVIAVGQRYSRGCLGEWPEYYTDDAIVNMALQTQAEAIRNHLLGCDLDDDLDAMIMDADRFYCDGAWVKVDIEKFQPEIDYGKIADEIGESNVSEIYNELTIDSDYAHSPNKPVDFMDFIKQVAEQAE